MEHRRADEPKSYRRAKKLTPVAAMRFPGAKGVVIPLAPSIRMEGA